MRKGVVLFLISFGIVNNCYALTFTGVKNSVENFAPNIATIDDIQKQPSNVAMIPDAPIISQTQTEKNIDGEKDVAKLDTDILPVEIEKEEEDKVEKEYVKPVKQAVIKAAEKKLVKKTKKTIKKNTNDTFDSLKVGDGKEILVSMSIPNNYKVDENKQEKIAEKKVVKKYKKRKKNYKSENLTTSITEPIIYDKQIILADSIKSKKNPIFPILNKAFKKEENDIVEKPTLEPVAPVIPETKTAFSNFDSDELPKSLEPLVDKTTQKKLKKNKNIEYINYGAEIKNNPFLKAFSALRPEKVNENKFIPTIASPRKKREKTIAFVPSSVLKNDLKKTYLSDNKYLSPVESVDGDDVAVEDEAQDENKEEDTPEAADTDTILELKDTDTNNTEKKEEEKSTESKKTEDIDIQKVKEQLKTLKKEQNITGSLKVSGREVLHMKIEFDKKSSALSTESINLLRSFGQIVVDKPTNSIEISLPMSVMNNIDKKKLTARRLAIVANVLRNTGISDKQINPVLSSRDEDSFAFRIISNDKIVQHKVGGGKDIMGDETSSKIYDLMKW